MSSTQMNNFNPYSLGEARPNTKPYRKIWSQADIGIMKEMVAAGKSAASIAAAVNRTEAAVFAYSHKHAISIIRGSRGNAWTPERDAELKRMHDDRLDINQMKQRTSRTAKAIISRLSVLGLSKNPHRRWSSTDKNHLIKLLDEDATIEDISYALNRTVHAVTNYCEQHGLRRKSKRTEANITVLSRDRAATRLCLGCHRYFRSSGSGNRRCQACKKQVENGGLNEHVVRL